MLSRENRVQLSAMAVALLVLIGFALVLPDDPGPEWIGIFVLVFYAIAFGGAHAYLYVMGEGGAVPRSARARFLAALALILPLWAGTVVVESNEVMGLDVAMAMGALSLLVFLVYFANEMRHGYTESQSPVDSR